MFLISVLLTLLFGYLTVKIIFKLICYRFKFRIKFKLNRLVELKNLHIFNQENENDLTIGKLWLSSCYLNRNQTDRLILCAQDISIKVNRQASSSSANSLLAFDRLAKLVRLFGASINLTNLNVSLLNDDKTFKLKINRLDVSSVNFNRIHLVDVNFKLTVASNEPVVSANVSNLNFDIFLSKLLNVNIDKPVLYVNKSKISQLSLFSNSRIHENGQKSRHLEDILKNLSKKISIQNFKIITSRNGTQNEESICGGCFKLSQNGSDTIEVKLESLDFLKILNKNTDRLYYKLVSKFRLKYRQGHLTIDSNDSNLYLNADFLKYLIDLKAKFKSDENSCTEFEINLNNFYINLIANDHIYTLGARKVDLTYLNEFKNFLVSNFLVFKSSISPESTVRSFKSNQSDRVKRLIERMSSMNEVKEKYNQGSTNLTNESHFIHHWGCLFGLDMLHIINQQSIISIECNQIFIEHSARVIDDLESILNKQDGFKSITSNRNSLAKWLQAKQIRLKIKAINFFFLYKEIYLIYFNLKRLGVKFSDANGLTLKLSNLSCIEYDLALDRQEQDALLKELDLTGYDRTQFYIIKYYQEDVNLIDSNYSLILLFKSICLSGRFDERREFCVTIDDMLITWSFRLHFIFNEELIKPLAKLFKDASSSNEPARQSNFKVNFLIESNILLNFLYDYEKDSSKSQPSSAISLPKALYFNSSNANNINTLSIILNCFYFSFDSEASYLSINVDDVTMFINVDDQNICSMLFGQNNIANENDEENNNCDELIVDSADHSDKRKFFHAKNFAYSYYGSEPSQPTQLKLEREMLDLKQKLNRTISVRFDLFSINFLFNYDFAKLIDHMLNMRKCLFLMHNLNSRNKEDSPIISPDLCLIVKKFQLTIEDDPFEVKLAYNYALMLDEHFESVKRHETLEQRRLIREKNLEYEALEILKEKESLIYLKRSKMIYSKPIRTQLFCFQIESFQLNALADLDWHGRTKCYDILREIDASSREPPLSCSSNKNSPAECYSILWCRYVCLSFNDFQFLFRDYTQPLLKIHKINLFGRVLGSEYEAHDRSKRDIKISVGREKNQWHTFNVQRSMSPFKLYHDVCSKMSLFSFAYGPCWEGCMAQLNLSLDKIIHPPRDPSRPMPWWDKSRLYLHGRLTSQIQQTQIIYHVSMDPYNHTEEMKLVWTQLYFDWKRERFLFKGCLDIYLNTESKYDDCCLLHLSDLEMCIDIDWLCKASANQMVTYGQHNYVMPCSPDKIPVVVNSHEHDSYSHFRSENLNLSIQFKIAKETIVDTQLPTLKFYASTSRFLQRIKNLLSAITRPTKRGRVFMNLKPRKPILSRHFKKVQIKIDIPKLNIIYWLSASEEYGAQIECNHFKMNSTHNLNLIPFVDKLKRRPRPNWSIDLMKCNLDNINLFLMSPSANKTADKHEENKVDLSTLNQAEYDLYMLNLTTDYVSIKFLDNREASKNFFMQIDSIYYERDNNNQRTTHTSVRPKHNLLVKNLKAKWNNINRDVLYNLYEIYNKAKRFRHNISSQALKECEELITKNSAYLKYLYQQSNCLNKTNSLQSKDYSINNNNSNFQELLEKLDMERLNNQNVNVYCDDSTNLDGLMSSNYNNNLLYGYHSANNMNDILNENVYIEFVNSQIKLSLDAEPSTAINNNMNSFNKPSSTNKPTKFGLPDSSFDEMTGGYVIISAAKTNVIQRLHRPVWKAQRLLDKVSWSGLLENMQYFATTFSQNRASSTTKLASDQEVSNSKLFHRVIENENIDDYWLSDDLIDSSSNCLGMLIGYENNNANTNMVSSTAKNEASKAISNSAILPPKSKKRRALIKIGRSSTANDLLSAQQTSSPPANNSAAATVDELQSSNSNMSQRCLQLIVSKCKCEFYIIDYDDQMPNSEEEGSTSANNGDQFCDDSNFNFNCLNINCNKDLNTSFNDCIDCITLIHHDLNVCTNSKQYKMIMNLVNNLVLYFRPRRKQIIDKQKSIKFNLQLSQGTDNLSSLKRHIQLKQLDAKHLLFKLRLLERKLYHSKENIESEMNDYNMKFQQQKLDNQNKIYIIHEMRLENKSMDKEYKECKKMLNDMMDELNISINCYREMMLEQRASHLVANQVQLLSSSNNALKLPNLSYMNRAPSPTAKPIQNNLNLIDLDQQAQQSILNNEIGRRYEVWFKQTQWKLLNDVETKINNQNLLAKFINKNLLYTKLANQQELDCVEHNLEIESIRIIDLISSNSASLATNNESNSGSTLTNKSKKNIKMSQQVNNVNGVNVLTSLFENQSSCIFNENENNEEEANESSPTDLNASSNAIKSTRCMFRMYCKERPPVGIPVIEHLEVNVSPLLIKLTNRFFKTIISYFFDAPPSASVQSNNYQTMTLQRNFHRHSYHVTTNLNTSVNVNDDLNLSNLSNSNSNIFNSTRINNNNNVSSNELSNSPTKLKNPSINHAKKPSQSSMITNLNNNINNAAQTAASQEANENNSILQIDDIEIMKQRSANNNTFLCIKITEIPLLVSYKGGDKEKNLKDLNNVSLLFPLFEVHDKTWTWLDLINALKSHVKKALLSQAIKHKLIKIPIQPVNKLISLSRRQQSISFNNADLANLAESNLSDTDTSKLDEQEKMTVIKLFGTKLIEKKSSVSFSHSPSHVLLIENSAQNFRMNKGESSNLKCKERPTNGQEADKDEPIEISYPNAHAHKKNADKSTRSSDSIKKKLFNKFAK